MKMRRDRSFLRFLPVKEELSDTVARTVGLHFVEMSGTKDV